MLLRDDRAHGVALVVRVVGVDVVDVVVDYGAGREVRLLEVLRLLVLLVLLAVLGVARLILKDRADQLVGVAVQRGVLVPSAVLGVVSRIHGLPEAAWSLLALIVGEVLVQRGGRRLRVDFVVLGSYSGTAFISH